MRKSVLLLFAVCLVGCGDFEDEAVEPTPGEEPEWNPELPPETITESTLELTYVSGHLGSYWDCPEEAYTPAAADRPAGESADMPASSGGAFADEDCDGEDCGGYLNCQAAQVTLMIDNLADWQVTGLDITDVELLSDAGDVLATLPVVSFDDLDRDVFDGSLGAEEGSTFRVEFRGPHNVDFAGVGARDAAFEAYPVRLIFEADEQEPASLDTPHISTLGHMAT